MNKIIVLSGKKRVGKDELAKHFIENGYTRYGFADKLKEEYKDYMVKIKKVPEELIDCYGDRKESDIGLLKYDGTEMTNRDGMQLYGQAMKILFGINCWVNVVCDTIIEDNRNGDLNVIITDCRFPFELERVKENLGGTFEVISVRIKRDTGLVDTHESETAFDDTPDSYFDYVIYNDGTLEEYQVKTKSIYLDILNK